MRHQKSTKKLGRDRAQRKALKKMLASSLVINGKIKTTEAKAKFVSPYLENIITISQQKTIDAKRRLYQLLNKKAASKLKKDLALKYSAKKGGYTRITKLMNRKGDNARIVQIELI